VPVCLALYVQMKFLQKYENKEAAKVASDQLSQVGILSHITVDGSSTIAGVLPDMHFVSLYVVLESQYDDAERFIEDRNHLVTTGLSKKEIAEIQKDMKDGVNASLNKALTIGLILVLAFVVFLVTQI